MSTATVRRDMKIPFLQIRYLKCNEKFAGTCVAVAGLLASVWTHCILAMACIQYSSFSYQRIQVELILSTAKTSHFLVVMTGLAGLYWGIKESNKQYLTPWLFIKLFEIIALFIGSILVTGNYTGLLPVGIIFLLISFYSTLCVWDAYKKMPDEPTSAEPENVSVTLPAILPDKPPSYDSFTNQIHTT